MSWVLRRTDTGEYCSGRMQFFQDECMVGWTPDIRKAHRIRDLVIANKNKSLLGQETRLDVEIVDFTPFEVLL